MTAELKRARRLHGVTRQRERLERARLVEALRAEADAAAKRDAMVAAAFEAAVQAPGLARFQARGLSAADAAVVAAGKAVATQRAACLAAARISGQAERVFDAAQRADEREQERRALNEALESHGTSTPQGGAGILGKL